MTRRSKTPIAETFGLWLNQLNEAHRQGLVTNCHELGRIAEGLRQLAESVCDRDPDWSHVFDTGKFDQQMFDMVWHDVTCWSTEGRVDELLCIESVYTEIRRKQEAAALRDRKPKVCNEQRA